ncbi:MAG TPA: hypothetical protein VHL08_04620 [Dongiaceae bacterium]|jgi:hypothetical protein|nr:hypothetical protein [Dongiaceae bacterium]
MSPIQHIRRGEQAQRLLEEPLLRDAFSQLRQEYLSQWEETPARDTQAREFLWLSVKLIERVRQDLQSIMTTGQLAQRHERREGGDAYP